METNKEIVEFQDVLENLSIQLQRCRAVYEMLSEALFEDIEPNEGYTYFYNHYVSLNGVIFDYHSKMDKIINQALEDIKKSPCMAATKTGQKLKK